MEVNTTTTSLDPVHHTTGGGREVPRRLPGWPTVEVVIMEMEEAIIMVMVEGTMEMEVDIMEMEVDIMEMEEVIMVMEEVGIVEVLATTQAITQGEGGVSETVSVPGL